MFWQDVLIGCLASDSTLRRAIAGALGTPTRRVKIVDSISEQPDGAGDGYIVLVERAQLAGEFPLQLSVFVNEPSPVAELRQPGASLSRVARLSEILQCSCLVSDDSLNPASWLRVLPSGTVERVMLDSELLDEDTYVVASVVPAGEGQGETVRL
jgi:hypothetical protein